MIDFIYKRVEEKVNNSTHIIIDKILSFFEEERLESVDILMLEQIAQDIDLYTQGKQSIQIAEYVSKLKGIIAWSVSSEKHQKNKIKEYAEYLLDVLNYYRVDLTPAYSKKKYDYFVQPTKY